MAFAGSTRKLKTDSSQRERHADTRHDVEQAQQMTKKEIRVPREGCHTAGIAKLEKATEPKSVKQIPLVNSGFSEPITASLQDSRFESWSRHRRKE
jgi:hypothetical protein